MSERVGPEGRRSATGGGSVPRPGNGKPSDGSVPSGGKLAAVTDRSDGSGAVPSVQRQKLTVRVNYEIYMELKLFCAFRGRSLSEVVEGAVKEYLCRHSRADDVSDRDDGDSTYHSSSGRETENTIINLYTELTGNRWTKRDQQAYQRIRAVPLEGVQMAMMMAALRAPRPIRSFAYFVPEILNPDYQRVRSSAEYMRYLRYKLARKRQTETQGGST